MTSRLGLFVLISLLVSALGVTGSFGKVGGKQGTDGPDEMRGGEGHNVMSGGEGDDSLYGFGANDDLFGGPGNDRIYGGGGDDYLLGLEGSDRLMGGNGNDVLESYEDLGAIDKLNGGGGDEDVCIAEEVDRVSPACEVVVRDVEKPGENALVCQRGCDLPGARGKGARRPR